MFEKNESKNKKVFEGIRFPGEDFRNLIQAF